MLSRIFFSCASRGTGLLLNAFQRFLPVFLLGFLLEIFPRLFLPDFLYKLLLGFLLKSIQIFCFPRIFCRCSSRIYQSEVLLLFMTFPWSFYSSFFWSNFFGIKDSRKISLEISPEISTGDSPESPLRSFLGCCSWRWGWLLKVFWICLGLSPIFIFWDLFRSSFWDSCRGYCWHFLWSCQTFSRRCLQDFL